MLSNLPRLKHLQLIASCLDDVIDGHRWQTKVKTLITFKFIFRVSQKVVSRQLNSFRTAFWLHDKQWFVAYTTRRFFSVPHLISTEVDDDFRLPVFTTAPDNNIFYESINQLQLTDLGSHLNDYFPQVHTLILNISPSVSSIRKIVDLRGVRHLMLFSLTKTLAIKSLINEMPKLSEISIMDSVEKFLKLVGNKRLHKIRTLNISRTAMRALDYNVDHLFTVFPNIEHLRIHQQCSIEQIFGFLHGFRCLSFASFHFTQQSQHLAERQHGSNLQSTLDQIQRVQNLSYTYRIDHSRIYFWLLPALNGCLT